VDKANFRLYLGIFLVSASTLCLEISLTRYFSITKQYHFAFFVVSIAFLGFGASGSFLSLSKKMSSKDPERVLSSTSLLFAVSIFLSFIVTNAIPFDVFRLVWERHQIFYIILYYFLLSIPFLFAGLTISFALSKMPQLVNKIYFFDLVGAGCGTLMAVFIFFPKGDRGVILIIVLFALCASMSFGFRRHLLFRSALIILVLISIVLILASPAWLSFRISPFKGLPLALRYSEAKIVITKWNSISRIDVLESPLIRFAPGLSLTFQNKLPDQVGLSIDGGELTAVTRLHDRDEAAMDFLSFMPSSFPYQLARKLRVLIIAPKGGVDVLAAHVNKAERIKVIENNPLIEKILRQELSAYTGGLYSTKSLAVISSNIRTSIKNETDPYDLIVLSLTDILGAAGTGLYGFGEKHLFTIESFESILDKLAPNGIASMTLYLLPPPRQELRTLSTWITALENKGKNPKEHLLSLRSWGTISYFIKNRPFSPTEIQVMKDFAEKNLFDLVYYPGIRPEEANIHNRFEKPLYYNYCQNLLSPEKRATFYKNYLFQVHPVSDDRPFFNNFFKAGKIKQAYESFGQKWLPFLQGEFIIPLILLQALVVASLMILAPLLRLKRGIAGEGRLFWKVFMYFGLIGMGFMFVEITFIQKFILILGHPLYSISLIIFSLLLSSGLGSLFSKKVLHRNVTTNLRRSIIICSGLIFLSLVLFPILYRHATGLPLVFKGILTLLFIFPLGFIMGFPFPTGIGFLEKKARHLIPWAWATNAFSSVINSVLALLVAFEGGYSLVLLMAGCCYLLTLPFLNWSSGK